MNEGFLLLHKPSGIRCSDLLNGIKRRFGLRSAGYAGTLDAFASGLLVAAFGRATKLLKYVMVLDKTYETVIRLGRSTDTLDPTGQPNGESSPPDGQEAVEEIVRTFQGTFEQTPPLYSSKKIQGKRASDLVRQGLIPDLKPSTVTIRGIDFLSYGPDGRLSLRIRCSSGTYIRSLARDIGARLGVPAMVESLIRTENGPFRLSSALDPGEPGLQDHIIPLTGCLPFLPRTEILENALIRVKNGAAFGDADCISGDLHNAVYNIIFNNSLLAIAERQDGSFRVLDGFGGAE